MCGRFIAFTTLEQLVQYFPIDVANVEVSPNYNVAPTQEILAIVRHDDDDLNLLEKLFWGLVPFWAKDPGIGSRMINARSETVESKPSFRAAFRRRRCLIPADGFFEWVPCKGSKQPVLLTLPDKKPFAFVGLWETWDDHGKREAPYRSCTILTRDASESVMPIHNRMPVILRPEAFGPWLDPELQDVEVLQGLIETQVHTDLASYPVSRAVNLVKNNRPENIEPVDVDG
jgi:putative SOS response-associated peptidase YedK